jgi:hypothetical protein
VSSERLAARARGEDYEAVEEGNLYIVVVCVADAYLVLKSAARNKRMTLRYFYVEFAHQLIDNVFDSMGLRCRQMIVTESVVYNKVELTSGVDTYLTPVKSKMRESDGSFTTNRAQGRFRVRKVKSTSMCSDCAKDASLRGKVPFICR